MGADPDARAAAATEELAALLRHHVLLDLPRDEFAHLARALVLVLQSDVKQASSLASWLRDTLPVESDPMAWAVISEARAVAALYRRWLLTGLDRDSLLDGVQRLHDAVGVLEQQREPPSEG